MTLGLLVGGKVNTMRAVYYWIAQFAGAIVAAILLWIVIPEAVRGNLGATGPDTG